MESQALLVTETFDGANDPRESPGGHSQTKGEEEEHVDHPVHHKGQVALEGFRDRDSKEGILEVDGATPGTCHDPRDYVPHRHHLELGDDEELSQAAARVAWRIHSEGWRCVELEPQTRGHDVCSNRVP